jgi:hypothetical protein
LPAFRLGGKLVRITEAEVEKYEAREHAPEKRRGRRGLANGEADKGSVTRLDPIARARLNSVRQRLKNDRNQKAGALGRAYPCPIVQTAKATTSLLSLRGGYRPGTRL